MFRFEDVIFNLYPLMASLKRKAVNSREMFLNTDPMAKN
jgi:hypothetical protein